MSLEPCWAKWIAQDLPIPAEAPVMKTVLFRRRLVMVGWY